MRENEETFVIGVGSMRLNLYIFLLEQFPVVTVFERRLYKDAIEVGRKVLPADDLSDEVYLWLEVCPRSHLVAQSLQLVNLLLL